MTFLKIKNWEKQYIPNYRKKKHYKLTKFMVLIIPFIIIWCLNWLKSTILSVKIKTRQSDVVLKNIIDGFAHLIYNDPEVEAIAKNRAAICATCPFAEKFGLYSIVVDNKTKQIQGMKCGKCGCNLSAKVRSMEDRCPLGKW